MCLAEVKRRVKKCHKNAFLTLLWTFRDRIASDPRDKIYSLLDFLQMRNSGDKQISSSNLGIATEELIIDYQADIEDVYASLVKSVVLGSDSIDILCACPRPDRFERSWVPDWTETWSRFSLLTNNLGLVPDNLAERVFRSSAERKPLIEFCTRFTKHYSRWDTAQHSVCACGTTSNLH